MRTVEFTLTYNNKTYPVHVTKKSQRNIYYRYRNGEFFVTSPYLVSKGQIIEGLKKFAPKLIKKVEAKNVDYSLEEGYVYLLGKKVPVVPYGNEGEGFKCFDEVDLKQKLKPIALEEITKRVRYFESIMGVSKPHKVRVKEMSSRHGSNSRYTWSLSFNLNLIHYSEEIIDSVVVHELAHDKYGGHQQNFYNYVLKYCPNYWDLKHKLNKRIHSRFIRLHLNKIKKLRI